MCSTYGESVYTSRESFKTLSTTIDETKICDERFDGFAAHGVPARPKEFPHMAALGYQKSEDPILWQCGGTLISESFVMTAGHCLQSGEL